jgi:hypothetical protein
MLDTVDQNRPPSSRELGPLRDIRGLCDVGLVPRDQTRSGSMKSAPISMASR